MLGCARHLSAEITVEDHAFAPARLPNQGEVEPIEE